MVSRVGIVGDGVIGMAIALVAASRGIAVTLFGDHTPGAASPASAGMLAPSVERSDGPGQAFSDAARAAWPRLLELVRVQGDPGFRLTQQGILQVALTEADADRLQRSLRGPDRWLGAAEARRAEPALQPNLVGAAHFMDDGLADVPSALASLERATLRHPLIARHRTPLRRLDACGAQLTLTDAAGADHEVDHGVLAAGVWSPTLEGLPRALPVTPLRGTLAAVGVPLLSVPVYGPDGHCYVLPREGGTVIGATADAVGFDATPGPSDLSTLQRTGSSILPALAAAPITQHWTGLRPMTPDRLPILGPDPALPALLYACGHSRNGFLQAALTAEVIADLLTGTDRADIGPFAVDRFIERLNT